jgi:hypothetical protein
MAQTIQIYVRCTQCSGTTFYNPGGLGAPSLPCNWPGCTNGYIPLQKITLDPGLDEIFAECVAVLDKCDNIANKCENIKDKCKDIKDKCNDIYDAVK